MLTLLTGEGAPAAERPARPDRRVAPGGRGRSPGRRPAALPPAPVGRIGCPPSCAPELRQRRAGLASTCGRSGPADRGQRRLPRGARGAADAGRRHRDRRLGARRERRRRRAAGSSSRTSCCVDYRLPGLDGVQVTRLVREKRAGRRRRRSHRGGRRARGRGAARSRRRRLHRQGQTPRRDRRGDSRGGAARGGGLMQLTAENTAVVLDSTADFPDGPTRFPNWRVVPLYVRFGDESFRDYVELGPHEFYERLRTASDLPTTSQPTPGDFLETYAGSAQYERILSLHIPANALRHRRERAARGRGARRRQGACDRQRHGVRRPRAARARRPASASSAARPTRRSTPTSRGSGARAGSSSPSTRSSTSPGAAGSGRQRRWRARC